MFISRNILTSLENLIRISVPLDSCSGKQDVAVQKLFPACSREADFTYRSSGEDRLIQVDRNINTTTRREILDENGFNGNGNRF